MVFPSICHEVMGPDVMILVFWMLNFKPAFHHWKWNPLKIPGKPLCETGRERKQSSCEISPEPEGIVHCRQLAKEVTQRERYLTSWQNQVQLITWRETLQYFGHLMPRATSLEKNLWNWERLRTGGEGDDRGQDGWMASPTQWAWVWASFRSWWWTGRPGVLKCSGSQRVGHEWVTEQPFTFGGFAIWS